MEDFIRMDHVTFTYPATEQREAFAALRDLSLSIEKGSFVAVIGQNGSGKSTLAKLINALLLPAEGTASPCSSNIVPISLKSGRCETDATTSP